MTIEWSSSRDLHLELRTGGRQRGLADALRAAIRDGRLPAGARLPSTRALAGDLGLARGTVTRAYEELAVQGHLLIRRGAGATVTTPATPPPPEPPQPATRKAQWSLLPGRPDVTLFPRTRWLAALRRAVTAAEPADLGYGDPLGHPRLRRALADYLGRARGVVADPDRVMVCGGFTHALSLLAGVLREQGAAHVVFEDPSLPEFRDVVTATGLAVTGTAVDADGLRVRELPSGADAVVVTPAHQLPLGGTLHARRRAELVGFAQRHDALVVEDDYDGEFRYDRQPVGAVQALAPERVVYAGTASKTLAPGLRLSWLVLPARLVPPLRAARVRTDRHTGVLEQLTMAEFLESGDYDRHVRRCRAVYRRRRAALLAALAGVPGLELPGVAAGVHEPVLLTGRTEAAVLAGAARASLRLDHLSRYGLGTGPPRAGLVLGYGAPAEHAFGPSLRALLDAFG
jgi:GntR family transcriptional regulator / MocR family aminotransferase